MFSRWCRTLSEVSQAELTTSPHAVADGGDGADMRRVSIGLIRDLDTGQAPMVAVSPPR